MARRRPSCGGRVESNSASASVTSTTIWAVSVAGEPQRYGTESPPRVRRDALQIEETSMLKDRLMRRLIVAMVLLGFVPDGAHALLCARRNGVVLSRSARKRHEQVVSRS